MTKKQLVVERRELPDRALWAGAIIAPIICATSVLELLVGAGTMSVLGILWNVFIVLFTGYYSYDFAKQVQARQKQKRTNTQIKGTKK